MNTHTFKPDHALHAAWVALAVAAAVVATMPVAVAADATSTMDKAATGTEREVSDSWITTKVKSEILANSVSKAFKVSVKTEHGVVALTGKLASQDSIDLVKSLAEKVKGVKSVDTAGLSVVAG